MKKIYFNISVCILFPLTVLFIVFLIQCFAWNIVDRSGDLENRYYSYGKIIKTEFTFSGREYYTDKG